MFLKREISGDEINLQVTGSLNGEPANEFQKNLEELAVGSHKIITLNLKEVNSINSSSIGKILLFRKRLAEQDRTIQIKGCSDALFNTFQLIKFDKLLTIEK
jgi:anti-sigma B factor antagonist